LFDCRSEFGNPPITLLRASNQCVNHILMRRGRRRLVQGGLSGLPLPTIEFGVNTNLPILQFDMFGLQRSKCVATPNQLRTFGF